MNIPDINYRPNSYQTPSFKSMRRKTLDKLGNVINCNYTNFNRKDIDWAKLANFLSSRYSFQDQTIINIYGCSDASDVYTLAINLINKLGHNALKHFKIFASDLSEDIIKDVKDGKIFLHKKDIEYLSEQNAMRFFCYDFNSEKQTVNNIEFYPYRVKKELLKSIDFSTKDVRDDVKKQNFSNAVFIFRNGWTFNTLDEQAKIADSLYKNSNDKTLIIIGQSDLYKSGASDFLQEKGFRGIQSNIFTKAETNYPSKTIGQPTEPAKYASFLLFEK